MKRHASVLTLILWLNLSLYYPVHPIFSQTIDSPIETIAGTGVKGYTGDDGPAVEARLYNPNDVLVLPNGNVLIADYTNHRIRRVDKVTGVITTFAGTGVNDSNGNLGYAIDAAIESPRSFATDSQGNIYVATLHRIRIIKPDGTIDRFAGSDYGFSGDSVPANEAKFKEIYGLDTDTDDSVFIADFNNHSVFQVLPNGIVITVAGTGTQGYSGDGGPATQAELNGPSDVAVHPNGTIFIAEQQGNRIRRIDPNEDTITTIYNSTKDSTFREPVGLTIYKDLFLYIACRNHTIRRLNLFNNHVDIVAGTGTAGFTGDGGPAIEATFTEPTGLDLDETGWLYIADKGNNSIRRIQFPDPGIEPTPTPTHTPTPTPTPTLGPTSTPTRTPPPRTQTPTPTMVPTKTPTATPTPLPAGQLAPVIPNNYSPGPNYEFFRGRTQVSVPFDPSTGKVKVLLSSSPDGKGQLLTRDTILLDVKHATGTIKYATIPFSELVPKDPENITSLFAAGINDVGVRLIDAKGSNYQSSELYVAVFSAPELKDIPDIRVLTGEKLPNALNLEDYIFDRDTPIADIVWSVTSNKSGPRVLRDSDNIISVEASDIPKGVTFTITASDTIFSVSEIVHLKVSSFRMNNFILPDAALVEDFAYIMPDSLFSQVDPNDANLADVPFETTFTAGAGLKAANVAHGEVYLFPKFPGGNVTKPLSIAITGKRLSDPEDQDGVIIHASSVFTPGGGSADINYNFRADSLEETNWSVSYHQRTQPGNAYLGWIWSDPSSFITDGYGVITEVDPGETVVLVSDWIDVPSGPATLSAWLAVDNIDGYDSDFPTVILQLSEEADANYSYTSIQQKAILGNSRYQYLSTTYNVIGTQVRAVLHVLGGPRGRSEVDFDNIRLYPSAWEIDRALGITHLPVEFDGTFETVLGGLGHLFEISTQHSHGSSAYITKNINRTTVPSGFNQALVMQTDASESIMYIAIGPNELDESIYPRTLTTRAYVQVLKEGRGSFSLGLTDGYLEAGTNISNDRLPTDPDWHQVTVSGYFDKNRLFDPTIILQNRRIPTDGTGLIIDGADLAVDDITLEAYQDPTFFWDHKKLPSRKEIINQ